MKIKGLCFAVLDQIPSLTILLLKQGCCFESQRLGKGHWVSSGAAQPSLCWLPHKGLSSLCCSLRKQIPEFFLQLSACEYRHTQVPSYPSEPLQFFCCKRWCVKQLNPVVLGMSENSLKLVPFHKELQKSFVAGVFLEELGAAVLLRWHSADGVATALTWEPWSWEATRPSCRRPQLAAGPHSSPYCHQAGDRSARQRGIK